MITHLYIESGNGEIGYWKMLIIVLSYGNRYAGIKNYRGLCLLGHYSCMSIRYNQTLPIRYNGPVALC